LTVDDEELSRLIAASALAASADADATDERVRRERAEQSERARLEAQRREAAAQAQARAAEERAHRRAESLRGLTKVLFAVPYCLVILAGFDLEHPSPSLVWYLVISVAISAILATAACYFSDRVLGRPLRWILAVCTSLGFSLGWWLGVAGGSQLFFLPILTTTLAYAGAAWLSNNTPAVATAGNPLLSASASAKLRIASRASWAGVLLGGYQLMASASPTLARSADKWARREAGSVWGFWQAVVSWFGGVSRTDDLAWWVIPCTVLIIVMNVWKSGRAPSGDPDSENRYSTAEAVIIAVAAVGSVLGILHQWTYVMLIVGYVVVWVACIGIALAIVIGWFTG